MIGRTSAICCACLIAWGCSDEFSPSVEGPRPYVVFGLLNSAVDTQYVRVHPTSAPTDPDPGNPLLPGTTVTVSGGGVMTVFNAMQLAPAPGAADTSMIPAYVAFPFRPVRGATYSLLVQSPPGNSTGTMTVPEIGRLSFSDVSIVQNPWGYNRTNSFIVEVTLASQALGFAVRFLVEYEHLISGQWIVEQREVPLYYEDEGQPATSRAVYPALGRRAANNEPNPFTLPERNVAVFTNGPYRATLEVIYNAYGLTNVRMLRAVFILNQADRNFFTYFALANYFQDRFSIRVDQPEYTNMSGSLGFFGSLTADTDSVDLPSNLQPTAAQ